MITFFKMNIAYLRYMAVHKWYTFIACYKLGVPWRGVVHDLSKFLPDEWFPYLWLHYGWMSPCSPQEKLRRKSRYRLAWLRHVHRNPHHWQWWVFQAKRNAKKVLPMPKDYACEMLADWYGAARAQGNIKDNAVSFWFHEQLKTEMILLHPETQEFIEELIAKGTME